MLRNMRIRTRLALMAAAPAVMALILVAVTFALVPSIAIGGSSYNQILVGRDFQAETGSPKLYILQIHNDVLQMAVTASAGQSDSADTADIAQLRAQYEAEYTKWATQQPLTNATARASLVESHEIAEQYFTIYDQQLVPLLRQETTSANRTRIAAQIASLVDNQLTALLQQHAAAIQSAATEVGHQVDAQENNADGRVRQQMLAIVGITLLLMAAAIALGITVLRSITDRVRRLNEVATIELPQVLLEVQRAAAAGEEIPAMPATASVEGGDELSTAAGAFNAVVSTAVDMAAEQARLRRSTSQMFINLGRRNHKLLSRTLTYITQLESDERDPATLQNLFRLDHLTTRMRRHAESLLVLAGSAPLRTWSRPVPVADVLRAALSEIETYDRVDVKELEPVEVRGASVSDLAHLIAELLENATAFSPPQTRVRVLGRTDKDGYTIVVVDEGIGMSPEELVTGNELIGASDRSGFLGDSRMLGLGVVGRLAARHGFAVKLTASPVGGVVAWITLPPSALAPRRGDGEHPAPSGGGLSAPDVAELLASSPTPDPTSSPDPGGAPETTAAASAAGLTPSSLPLRPVGASAGEHGTAPDPTKGSAVPLQPTGADAQPDRPTAPLPAGPVPTGSLPTGPVPTGPVPTGPVPTGSVPIGTGEEVAGGTPTGSIVLPPRAPAAPTGSVPVPTGSVPVPTGSVPLPVAPQGSPVSGPITFRKPTPRPGESTGLTRRVRGAQLPDTGDAPADAPTTARPARSAQSVRGALQSFTSGRRTASDLTMGNVVGRAQHPDAESRTPERTAHPNPSTSPTTIGDTADRDDPAARRGSAHPTSGPGGTSPLPPGTTSAAHLPRRVKGAQMPRTDLPESTPAPERSADEVRAALSNFVAGRRAAEHED